MSLVRFKKGIYSDIWRAFDFRVYFRV